MFAALDAMDTGLCLMPADHIVANWFPLTFLHHLHCNHFENFYGSPSVNEWVVGLRTKPTGQSMVKMKDENI